MSIAPGWGKPDAARDILMYAAATLLVGNFPAVLKKNHDLSQ
jgi:hypothetical protein